MGKLPPGGSDDTRFKISKMTSEGPNKVTYPPRTGRMMSITPPGVPPPDRSKVWGRWLRIALLVGFVLDVLLAIHCHALRQGLPPEAFWPMPQPQSGLTHVPPGERLVFFVLAVFLFAGWARAISRPMMAAGPVALLFGDTGPWESLPPLEFGVSARQLLLAWRVLLPLTLGGWILLLCWTVIFRPAPSIVGFQTETVLAVLLCLTALLTVALVELAEGRRTPYAARTPPRPVITRAASAPPSPASTSPDACVGCGAASSGGTCAACGATRIVRGFRTERVLASKPHGWTYLVRDAQGGRAVLKEVRFSRAPDAKIIDAFQREAALLGKLRLPGVPALLDAFQVEEARDTRLYLAMEWIEGRSLAEVIAPGPMPEARVRRIVVEVLQLLRELHEREVPIVHRDIKPSNLILQRSGSIAMVDFGVARDLIDRMADATLVGTVGYMPPEQLAGHVDCTSDLYALGVTAMTLLTGRDPSELLTPDAVLALPRLPVSRSFGKVLRRLAAPRRAQRFPGARQALEALGALPAGGRWRAVVAGFLVVVGAVGAALWLRHGNLWAPGGDVSTNAATFPGGAVSLEEYWEGVQSMPLSFRRPTPHWEHELVQSLATLKQLSAAARTRKLVSDLHLGRAGLLQDARALAKADGVLALDVSPAEHRARYLAWLGRYVTPATVNEPALRANPLVASIPAVWAPSGGGEARFTVDFGAGECQGVTHPGNWYEARCDPALDFAGLGPMELLYAELSVGGGTPFVHTAMLGSAPAFKLPPTVAGANSGRLLPTEEPDDLERVFPILLRRIEVDGDLTREAPQIAWDRARAPFLRCLRSFLWANRYPGPEGEVTLQLRVTVGQVTINAADLDTSQLGRSEYTRWSPVACTTAFSDWIFPAAGPGTVRYVLRIQVEPAASGP